MYLKLSTRTQAPPLSYMEFLPYYFIYLQSGGCFLYVKSLTKYIILILLLTGISIQNKCGKLQHLLLACQLCNLVFHSVGQKENIFELDGFHITLIYSRK